MSSSSGTKMEFQVGDKYRLVRRIGTGSFGDIYLGVNITNGEVRALRLFSVCLNKLCIVIPSGMCICIHVFVCALCIRNTCLHSKALNGDACRYM